MSLPHRDRCLSVFAQIVWIGDPGRMVQIHDPDLWLERTFGNEIKVDQKHVVKVHEPLPNFPSLGAGHAYGLRSLGFSFEQHRARNFTTT